MLKPLICISPRENSMSIENMAPDLVCSIQCNFCNTILAVNVPSSTVCPAILTVRCGHCANLLPINIAASLQPLLHQDQIHQLHKPYIGSSEEGIMAIGSSSKGKNFSSFESNEQKQPRMLPPIHPPEKKQRVPSAYNRFIKEEIQRIKASNPDISHREAFSTAAKNWAHFPHIHFGLQLDNGNTQTKLDHHHHHHHHSFRSAASTHKSHAGFY